MYYVADTLDDLLARILPRLAKTKAKVRASRGETREMVGVLLKLRNPRARLSRSETKGHIFSCLGELSWYLSGSNKVKFISYYIPKYKEESEDKVTVHGAYGPRLYPEGRIDQITNIIEILKAKPTTRRAVIQLFESGDIINRKKDVPCTCTLHFLLRKNRLHAVVNVRSNDAFKGLPHDIFAFTMLQEIIARSVGVDIGEYIHQVGSLHLYDNDLARVSKYRDEGWQSTTKPMPPMPEGSPWPAIKKFLKAEVAIRSGREPAPTTLNLPDYWADLVRLLRIFAAAKNRDAGRVAEIRLQMAAKIYDACVLRRLNEMSKKKA